MRRRLQAHLAIVALAGALVQAAPIGAQGAAAGAPSPAAEWSRWRWDRCMLGLTYGAPQKLALGYARGLVYEAYEGGADSCAYLGAKAGLSGSRLSLGIARTINALGGGVGLSAGVLRTYNRPLGAADNRSYAGVSVHLMPLFALGGELGWYVRLGRDEGVPDAQRRLLTWSAGFGF
jgi:hypothetical protein